MKLALAASDEDARMEKPVGSDQDSIFLEKDAPEEKQDILQGLSQSISDLQPLQRVKVLKNPFLDIVPLSDWYAIINKVRESDQAAGALKSKF